MLDVLNDFSRFRERERVCVCVYVCACVCVYMFKTCWGASDDDNRGTELVLRLNLSAEISQTIKERF